MSIRKLRWRVYKKKGGGRIFGNRCKEFDPDCIICLCWKFRDENGRFPVSFDEVAPVLTSINYGDSDE